MRVLGGRGAVEDEEDLPDLSDSGDEAAWEDEDDAELPHDKQQTPCLFCDRFVRSAPGGARATWVRVPGPRLLPPVVRSAGLWRRETPGGMEGGAMARKPVGLQRPRFPRVTREGFALDLWFPILVAYLCHLKHLGKNADAELRTTVLLGQDCSPGISLFIKAPISGD